MNQAQVLLLVTKILEPRLTAAGIELSALIITAAHGDVSVLATLSKPERVVESFVNVPQDEDTLQREVEKLIHRLAQKRYGA